jgi:hypothetical protein
MKILRCIAVAILFTTAFPDHSQTMPNGESGSGIIASARSDVAIAAIAHGLIPQGKPVLHSRSALLSGWVRDWNLTKTWSKGAWVNMVQNAFTYDSYANQLSQLGQVWENSAWKNSLLQTWTYDGAGNEITHASQTWNGSAWSGTAVDTEMYNASGQRTSMLSRYLSGSAWVNQYLYTYAYDANGNETIDLCQSWSGGAWVNSRRWTFSYDTNGYYVNFLWEVWTNGAWVNYGRMIITNDAGGRETYSLEQAWYEGVWVNYGQDTFTYDGKDRKTTDLYDTWESSAWLHSRLNSFTYDANGNKTDELEQAWKSNAWENAAWYIDSWKKIPDLQVLKPATSEVVLAGAPYTIQWRSAGIDSLLIDFSVDGGSTYQRVARGVAASTGKYSWMVPDTLSARCILRLADQADPSSSVLSGRFKVKGYRLTRTDAYGDYEAFDPGVHGWNFRNDTTSMWPASWWSQFDYPHNIDPFTGKPYWSVWFYIPINATHSDDHIDWPLFVRLFSVDSCYVNVSKGIYSQLAVELWHWGTSLRRGFVGACLGFAVSSLLAFEHPAEFQQSFPEVGGYQHLHDLPVNSDRRRVINQIYAAQYGAAPLLYIMGQKDTRTPRNTLEDLKTSLFSDSLNHRHLGLYHMEGGGHAVVPYRMEKGETEGEWNLYVYDSNCPTGDCHGVVWIDSAGNDWEYDPLSWANYGHGLVLHLPPLEFLKQPVLWDVHMPVSASRGQASLLRAGNGQAGSYVRLFNTNAAITITNARGETAGFHDSTAFNGFSDGQPIDPEAGSQQRPIGYVVPSGAYSVEMHGFADSTAAFAAFGSQMFKYWRTGAGRAQTDLLTYDNGLAVGNPDQATKKINLESITRVSTDERVFQVLNCSAFHADSVIIMTPDADRLTFMNRGPQKTYDLMIKLASPDVSGMFSHAGITMPANSSQYILPNWADLENQSVKIYEDIGNTGSIHDTLTLTNQLTGVGGQLDLDNPQEFHLDQNYPNPFNPITTIRYGLPIHSHVTLTVFNTLGQQVAVLQNGEQDAGFHEVRFDGANLPSGVYFYRMQAGSTVETKKLLLVK